MTLPLATTTIAVRRPTNPPTEDPYGDGYDDPADRDDAAPTVATGVRAVIAPTLAGSTGGEVGGQSEVVEFRLTADPCDLTYGDTVLDEVTAEEFLVIWSHTQPAVAGLEHVQAKLRTVKGRSQ